MSEQESPAVGAAPQRVAPQRSDALVAELHSALERASELIHSLKETDSSPPPTADPGREKLLLLKDRLATAEAGDRSRSTGRGAVSVVAQGG
jgi:hypothetical protein